MTKRLKTWLAILPFIGILGIFAFVPNVAALIPLHGLIWGLPIASICVALAVAVFEFRGQRRMLALAFTTIMAIFCVIVVAWQPTGAVMGFASAAMSLPLVIIVEFFPSDAGNIKHAAEQTVAGDATTQKPGTEQKSGSA